jgi:hypothetical protein
LNVQQSLSIPALPWPVLIPLFNFPRMFPDENS